MLHKHKWDIIESHKFDSELQNFHGVRMDGYTANDLAKRGVITIVQCKICDKVKHMKTIL